MDHLDASSRCTNEQGLIHNNGKITSTRKRKGFPFLQALWPPLSLLKSALSLSLLSLGLRPSLHLLGIGPVLDRAWLMTIHSIIYNRYYLVQVLLNVEACLRIMGLCYGVLPFGLLEKFTMIFVRSWEDSCDVTKWKSRLPNLPRKSQCIFVNLLK